MTGRAWAAALLLAGMVPAPWSSAPAVPEDAAAVLGAVYRQPPAHWPPPLLDPGVPFVELGPLPLPPSGPREAERARLGERLFNDPALSRSGTIACRGCHDPAQGWADGRKLPSGPDGLAGRRNSPSLVGTAFRTSWRWDGRHGSLDAALLAPLIDPAELANPDLGTPLARLAADEGYAAQFHAAFGSGRPTERTLAAALSAFVGSIDGRSSFDRFLTGDHAALSDEEIRGLHLFRTRAGCANCHFGPLLTDEAFHNLRLSSFGEASEDLGCHEVTGSPDDAGRFRTPSLRALSRTAPYMHNGQFRTLEGVINLYARGGGDVRARHQEDADRPLFVEAARLDPHIRPLDLTAADKAALLAFLRSL